MPHERLVLACLQSVTFYPAYFFNEEGGTGHRSTQQLVGEL